MSRRTLILGALAGAVAGGAWGAVIQTLAMPSAPTVSVIGKGASQIALLDTTRVRALILLGPANPDLVESVPTLLTMVRQRIDIVIGASDAIGSLPPEFMPRRRVAHTFAVPAADFSTPDTSMFTSVTEDLHLDLGNDIGLEIRHSTRDAWNAGGVAQRLWTVRAVFGTATLIFAPDEASADVLPDAGAAVLVVPKGDADRLRRLWSPSSIAINARDGLEAVSGTPLVRIFPGDVARFKIDDDRVALPPWAVTTP